MTNSQPPTPDPTDSWDGAEGSDEADPTGDADRSTSANLPEGADGPEATDASEAADGTGTTDDTATDGTDATDGGSAAAVGSTGAGDTGEAESVDGAEAADGGDEDDYLPPGQTSVPVGDEVVVDDDTMRRALEAILMVTDEPLPVLTLARAVGRPTGDVAGALAELAAEYTEQGRGFDLREVGGGWRYYTRVEAAPYVERFVLDGQQARLTQAALETLSVVAYKQPVSRARVSAIRGVNVDGVMRTLVARGLVEEAGSDTESQATLYRTTSYFLERMGMQSLDDLPELAPYLPDMDDIEDELAAQSLPPAEPTPETTTAEGADADGAGADGAGADGAGADGADAEAPDGEGADAEALDVEGADAEGVGGLPADDELDAEASGGVAAGVADAGAAGGVYAAGGGELDAEDRGDDGDAVDAPAQAESAESAEASGDAADEAEVSGWAVEPGAEDGDDVVSDGTTVAPAGEPAGEADAEDAEEADGAADEAEVSDWAVESGAEDVDDVASGGTTVEPAGEPAGEAGAAGLDVGGRVEGGVRDGG